MLCISFFTLLFLYIYLYVNFFPHSTFNNDDMKSSKHQVTFLSLIFLLKYKIIIIKNYKIAQIGLLSH